MKYVVFILSALFMSPYLMAGGDEAPATVVVVTAKPPDLAISRESGNSSAANRNADVPAADSCNCCLGATTATDAFERAPKIPCQERAQARLGEFRDQQQSPCSCYPKTVGVDNCGLSCAGCVSRGLECCFCPVSMVTGVDGIMPPPKPTDSKGLKLAKQAVKNGVAGEALKATSAVAGLTAQKLSTAISAFAGVVTIPCLACQSNPTTVREHMSTRVEMGSKVGTKVSEAVGTGLGVLHNVPKGIASMLKTVLSTVAGGCGVCAEGTKHAVCRQSSPVSPTTMNR